METFFASLTLCAGNSPVTAHKGQWCETLKFSLICAWINGWVNNHEAGDSRRHRTHYDVTVMDPAYRRHFQPQVSGCQPIMSFTNMLKYVLRCSFRSDRITYKQTKPSLILCHKNLMTRLCIIFRFRSVIVWSIFQVTLLLKFSDQFTTFFINKSQFIVSPYFKYFSMTLTYCMCNILTIDVPSLIFFRTRQAGLSYSFHVQQHWSYLVVATPKFTLATWHQWPLLLTWFNFNPSMDK